MPPRVPLFFFQFSRWFWLFSSWFIGMPVCILPLAMSWASGLTTGCTIWMDQKTQHYHVNTFIVSIGQHWHWPQLGRHRHRKMMLNTFSLLSIFSLVYWFSQQLLVIWFCLRLLLLHLHPPLIQIPFAPPNSFIIFFSLLFWCQIINRWLIEIIFFLLLTANPAMYTLTCHLHTQFV